MKRLKKILIAIASITVIGGCSFIGYSKYYENKLNRMKTDWTGIYERNIEIIDKALDGQYEEALSESNELLNKSYEYIDTSSTMSTHKGKISKTQLHLYNYVSNTDSILEIIDGLNKANQQSSIKDYLSDLEETKHIETELIEALNDATMKNISDIYEHKHECDEH